MKNLLKGKAAGVLIVAALILGSTAILSFAMSTAQDSMDREVVMRTIPAGSEGAEYGIPDFPTNASGQTYGSGGFGANNPDLILATGIDGTTGYVLSSDLEGAGPLDRPNNPEEAMEYMRQLEELENEARARGVNYLYSIPLYASDGQTIIGQFGVGNVPPPHPQDETELQIIVTYDGQSAVITFQNRVIRDITLTAEDRFELRIEPVGIQLPEEIIFTSSDQSVFEVITTNPHGTEAILSVMGRGSAVLLVSVGGIEAECIVRVR